MNATDSRLELIRSREAVASRAKTMRPAEKDEVDALRDLLRQEYPKAAVRAVGTRLPTVSVFPQHDVLTVEQANRVRDLLRYMGFVDLADGAHTARTDYAVRSFGNLLIDCAGSPESVVPELAQRRLNDIAALTEASDSIARVAVAGSGFTKRTHAAEASIDSRIDAIRQRPGTVYLERRISNGD